MSLSLLSTVYIFVGMLFFFLKQKTAYEMRISDWSSDVCSSDLPAISGARRLFQLSADLPLDEALRVGREIGFASFSDPDTAEGIAAYAEGRAAAFRKPI